MKITLIYLITFVLYRNFCAAKNYTNYALYRVVSVNGSHVDFISKLSKRYEVNFWRGPGAMYHPVDFVISPQHQEDFLIQARKIGLFYTKVIDDVQSAFDKQTVMTYIRRQMSSMNWLNYFRLDDIYSWLRDLSIAYPKEVTVKNIGRSHQNRPILSARYLNPGSTDKPVIIIEGGIHAREWISPAVVTYLLNSIVHSEKTRDPNLRLIALSYEWHFVPVLNPDGYEYTFTDDRQWRKNRNGNGVDLNRNFAHVHGTSGISKNPADENYCGQTPFSERETKAMAELVKSFKSRLHYYISFHSYGQYMILPYADTPDHKDNYDEVAEMCREAGKRIHSKYKTRYDIGTAFETVGYTASGMSNCWVKKSFGIPYVVTYELRDQGQEGFALPPDQILPTCEETLQGIIAFTYPRSLNRTYIKRESDSAHNHQIMDKIVIFVNFVLFIIARFD